jgi:hypothetical protein
MEPTVESKKVILIKLHWHILTEVRVFGGLSDHDTLLLRYHDPHLVVLVSPGSLPLARWHL